MYEIKRTEYGLLIVMGGKYEHDEISSYIKEKEELISTIQGPYSLLVDLRTAMPPENSDAALLRKSHERLADTNVQRMAFVISSPVLLGSARQVLVGAGSNKSSRIINASKTPYWLELALDWITDAIDPEHNPESAESIEQPT